MPTPGQLVLPTPARHPVARPARLAARWWLGQRLAVALWAWASMVGVARPHFHCVAAAASEAALVARLELLEAALVVVEAEAALVANVLALEAALLPALAAGRHWLAVPAAALPPCSPPPPPLLLLLVLLPVLPVPGPVLLLAVRRHWPPSAAALALAVEWGSLLCNRHWPAPAVEWGSLLCSRHWPASAVAPALAVLWRSALLRRHWHGHGGAAAAPVHKYNLLNFCRRSSKPYRSTSSAMAT